MAFDDEIIKNAVRMKNCKKIWGCVFYAYLIGGILMILYSFLSITGVSWDWLFILVGTDTLAPIAVFMILDSLISAPLGFFLALKGSYQTRKCKRFPTFQRKIRRKRRSSQYEGKNERIQRYPQIQ